MEFDYQEERMEYSSKEKLKKWETAIGLQKTDNLEPSAYLIELAKQNIDGTISVYEVEDLLYQHYKDESPVDKEKRLKEADLVATRINQLLCEDSFSLNPGTLKAIHRYLFRDIYPEIAGEYRTTNLTKKEPVIGMNTIKYANYFAIEDTLSYDFSEEKKTKYQQMTEEEIVKHISRFTSSIWQVHPFREGNTRTTAVFIERYLNSMGFSVDNEPFSKYSKYFRNALVRSNYVDYQKKVYETDLFLNRFFENVLFEGKNLLNNRDLIAWEYLSVNDKIKNGYEQLTGDKQEDSLNPVFDKNEPER